MGEDRCPRRFIKEDPEWWYDLINHHNAYEAGILPNAGGLADQPALFLPLMATISNALHNERELDKATVDERQSLSQQFEKTTGISLPGSASKKRGTSLL